MIQVAVEQKVAAVENRKRARLELRTQRERVKEQKQIRENEKLAIERLKLEIQLARLKGNMPRPLVNELSDIESVDGEDGLGEENSQDAVISDDERL